MNFKIKSASFGAGLLLVGAQVLASSFTPPPVGTKFYTTSKDGDFVNEVLSVESDRYTTRSTKVGESKSTETTRFLGLITFSKERNEGILALDRDKSLALFPLKVGNKVAFSHYGGSGNRWYRDINIEVVSEQKVQIGADDSPVCVLKGRAESPGIFKMEVTCDYAPRLAICIRSVGDQVIRGNAALTGPFDIVMTKAVINGVELPIRPTAVAAGVTAPAAPAPAPAPALTPALTPEPLAASPAAASTAVPISAEQRLKQAKDLLDKQLINEQQYNEFVAKIMKDM